MCLFYPLMGADMLVVEFWERSGGRDENSQHGREASTPQNKQRSHKREKSRKRENKQN